MKVLDQDEYVLIFFKAMQYDSVAKISAYFKGKFNEVKDCNPIELYIDGLTKAYEFFIKQFENYHNKELKNYYDLLQFGKNQGQYKRPDINEIGLPAIYIDPDFRGHYNYNHILTIKQGLDEFNKTERKHITDEAFILETNNLKDWILPDHLSTFTEIEKQLFFKGIIDNTYQWKWGKYKGKKKLIDFVTVITEYGFFRQQVNRKRKQSFHYRQFFSQRYGFGKSGLTEVFKKYKPTIQEASIPFAWIPKPE